GVSTDAGGNSTIGFAIEPFAGAGRLNIGNLIINTSSTGIVGNRFVTHRISNVQILGDLTITSGRYQPAVALVTVAGNIVNNGEMVAPTTLAFATGTGTTSSVNTIAQSVSGSGVFGNNVNLASATASFASLTVNNNSTGVTFSGNALLSGSATGTLSGTLTFTQGFINVPSGNFILGVSPTTTGTLSYTAGGFSAGSSFSRWIASTTGGSTITSGSNPSGDTGRFPFIIGTIASPVGRSFYLNRTTAASTGGLVTVIYNDVAGVSTTSFTDGTYNVNRRSNSSWTVSQSGITGTPTYAIAAEGSGIFIPSNNNARLTGASAAAAGTHAGGSTSTITPVGQRTAVALADLGNVYYLGIDDADVPFFPVANGNWSDGSTWNKGVVPNCSANVLINGGFTVTVNSASNVADVINVTSTGTLVVASGDLTVGCTENNNQLLVAGVLTVNGGTLNVNGQLRFNSTSTFNQSGGNIVVDGNDNGNVATSVASTAASFTYEGSIVYIQTININVTGGTLTIVDPHAGASTTYDMAIGFSQSTNVAFGTSHTIRFGDGVSTDAGGNVAGFVFAPWVNTGCFHVNNLVIDAGVGTNRMVSCNYDNIIRNDFTVTSGEFLTTSTQEI
ncbi:MAG: beta strand repeat-containing protein, partial [Dolichospermum sp.]